jgi:inner membrane protein
VDPITQGALGAAASMVLLHQRAPFSAWKLAGMGMMGGMAADLDVLIKSSTDPLLAIEYHRHFTHSLAFVPVGGAIAALPWLLDKAVRARFAWAVIATTTGYATHGLLDACTTYGTLLFWPFSDARVNLRWISVVDPLFTVPLLVGVLIAARHRQTRWAGLGLLWATLYMGLGAFQHWRASTLQRALVQVRGHMLDRGQVFPTFMNNTAWRSVYQSGGRYYVDKLRVTLTGRACATPGTSVPLLDNPVAAGSKPEMLHPASERAHRLIRWFSDGWVALDPEDPSVIGDLRYSFSPTEVLPIWGVRIQNTTGAVEWVNNRSRRAIGLGDLVALVTTDGAGHRCF